MRIPFPEQINSPTQICTYHQTWLERPMELAAVYEVAEPVFLSLMPFQRTPKGSQDLKDIAAYCKYTPPMALHHEVIRVLNGGEKKPIWDETRNQWVPWGKATRVTGFTPLRVASVSAMFTPMRVLSVSATLTEPNWVGHRRLIITGVLDG